MEPTQLLIYILFPVFFSNQHDSYVIYYSCVYTNLPDGPFIVCVTFNCYVTSLITSSSCTCSMLETLTFNLPLISSTTSIHSCPLSIHLSTPIPPSLISSPFSPLSLFTCLLQCHLRSPLFSPVYSTATFSTDTAILS